MDTKTKMKDYYARSPYSEQGIAGMMGMPQSIFSGVVNGKFHRNPDSNEAKMETWLERVGLPLEKVTQMIRILDTERYVRRLPGELAHARIRLHSLRAKLMQGEVISNKTGMRKSSKTAAPLQS